MPVLKNTCLIKCNHSFLFVMALPLHRSYERGVQQGLHLFLFCLLNSVAPFLILVQILMVPQLNIYF